MTKTKTRKSKIGRILAAVLVAAMIFPASPMIASAAADDVYGSVPTVTTGRVLTPSQTGDKVNWIEVAKSGNYSLIVRSEYLHFNRNYNDPFWQYYPYGATNSSLTSNVRQKVNTWFTALLPTNSTRYYYTVGDDALPVDARLRNFTMQNTAISILGTTGTRDGLTNGLSKPMSIQAGTANDVAFVLSFSEAASFISDGRAVSGYVGNEYMSPAEAVANFQKINVPTVSGLYTNMWLRSPGTSAATVGSVSSAGYASQTLLSSANYVGYIYPALWVNSDIFGVSAPATQAAPVNPPAATLAAPATPAAAPANTGTYGVMGRTLTPDLTGDNVNWVEIAKNGNYSLIVRTNYISVARGYGDPAWQYCFYGSLNYMTSTVRDRINIWFNGRVPSQYISGWNPGDDGLAPDARMRNYTVQSDVLSKLGTSTTHQAVIDGISSPTSYQVGAGRDIAFALSYSESANYLSIKHFLRLSNPSQYPSSDLAAYNFSKISIPQYGHTSHMWLRSVGDCPNTMGSLGWNGVCFQATFNSSYEPCYIYPAVWVDQGIFETKPVTTTVTVEHINAVSGTKLMSDEVFNVTPGFYGPYLPKYFFGYAAGYWDNTSAPILGMINAGQNLVIRYYYLPYVE
jgi:hypothetical protein